MKGKKTVAIISAIVGSISIVGVAIALAILTCILMIFNFFSSKLYREKITSNIEYAEEYINVSNKYFKNGYVPLQRILYFHLEDPSLTFDTLYQLNQDEDNKFIENLLIVCGDERVANLSACSADSIDENIDYLVFPTPLFNFPLLEKEYTITSFYGEQRMIYDEPSTHGGWDFAVSEKTPVYSVCDGTVEKVEFTQDENITYDKSNNKVGNTITIKCNQDYFETYYVTFMHLYPNSSKVKVGDSVNHFTEIASVGTTGWSTGNHLHYQVADADWNLIDGMQLIDFNLEYSDD